MRKRRREKTKCLCGTMWCGCVHNSRMKREKGVVEIVVVAWWGLLWWAEAELVSWYGSTESSRVNKIFILKILKNNKNLQASASRCTGLKTIVLQVLLKSTLGPSTT